MKPTLIFVLGVLALLFTNADGARADEGMWTFDNFPSAAVQKKYGVNVDQAWLDRVRGATLSLSTGCSASIVSAEGLVLTNHHCVRECVQANSTAKSDFIKDGFAALKPEDERLCPGTQAELVAGITNVTDRVTKATAGKPPGEFQQARNAEIAAIEKEGCAGREATHRCEVITLYYGGQYMLHTYRIYSDVRLVFAPEADTAFFGGDPDNYNFPRYDLDCSFVRLYENGKPVATPNHLTWREAAPHEGEPVFVAGSPGATQRLLTAEQLQSLRDFELPNRLLVISELRGRVIRFTEENPEHARVSQAALFDIENIFKALHSQEQTLVDPALILAKRAADLDLQAHVAKDAKLAKEIGDPWSDLAQVQIARHELSRRYMFTESLAGMGALGEARSDLFAYARQLVRAAQDRVKPDGERLPEYGDSRLALTEKSILDPKPVYPDLEQVVLEFWLSKLRENLTADAPGTKTFLGKESPEQLSARLVTSRLGDPAYRKQLWDGGLKAIEASGDPMIRFVLATDPASREIRKEYEERVTGPTARDSEKIAKARFAVYGTKTYPDATNSLRLTYGKVIGWTENGATVPAFTTFDGLWSRATGQFPFALTPRWAGARESVNPQTVFNFVSDTDVLGGNSGSPVVDAKGDVIGAIFDGNIDSLGGAYGFNDKVNRAVAVSTAAITEALTNVYKNPKLVAELTGR